MNSRYLIVLLLLGGIVYGLTTAVAVCWQRMNLCRYVSAQVEWSSVPNVGVSAPAERSFSVPASSRRGSSLFHHPAVYSGVSVPQGYSGSGLTTGVPSSGTYAVSSAYSPSQGLYLTSSAVLQSYGGGAESGMYASSGSHSAASSVSPSSAGVSLGAMSVSPVASSPSYSSVSSSYALAAAPSAMPYTSAQQSAPHRNGSRRAPGTIGGTLDNWIQGLVNQPTPGSYLHGKENGIWYFYEDELRALYESAIANGDLPVGTTWDQFLKWFANQSSKYQFYTAPLPDGIGVLCLFALLYMGIQLLKYHKRIVR